LLSTPEEAGCIIVVHVHPNSASDRFTAIKDDVVHIRLRARPVEGKANTALAGFLAKSLDIRKNEVSIARGDKSRNKQVNIKRMSRNQVMEKIAALLIGPDH